MVQNAIAQAGKVRVVRTQHAVTEDIVVGLARVQ